MAPVGRSARGQERRCGVGAAVVDATAYVVMGGRKPGLFTTDVTETLALP
jgi:hypothetical protein